MIPAPPVSSGSPAPHRFRLRTSLAFCAPLAVNGVALPYFPVWLETLRYSELEIGIILAIPMIVRIIAAPLVSMLADRLPERADVLVWSGGLSLLSALVLFLATGFWPVLLIYSLQAAFFAPYAPVVDSIAITGVRRWGFDYSSMRGSGSVAFVFATLAIGAAIGVWGGGVVLHALALGFCFCFFAGFVAPRVGRARNVTPAGGKAQASSLRQPQLQWLMIGASIVQASHGMLYAFSSIYWQEIGFSGTQIGILWSAGVTAEVAVFFLAAWIFRRLGPWTLLRIGCAVAVCRWLLFPMSLDFGGYLLLQCTHAFTFAFVHIGVQRRIVDVVQEEQEASAQGAYFFYNGAFLALVTFFSGAVYREMGMAAFYLMAIIALAGLACVIVASHIQPQSSRSGGKTSEPS